jgi:hypothetical protein
MIQLPLILVLALTKASLEEYQAPLPTAENRAAWQVYIAPTADETRHESIPWLSSFSAGILAAEAAGKPLLFWGMNGHPLGCT